MSRINTEVGSLLCGWWMAGGYDDSIFIVVYVDEPPVPERRSSYGEDVVQYFLGEYDIADIPHFPCDATIAVSQNYGYDNTWTFDEISTPWGNALRCLLNIEEDRLKTVKIVHEEEDEEEEEEEEREEHSTTFDYYGIILSSAMNYAHDNDDFCTNSIKKIMELPEFQKKKEAVIQQLEAKYTPAEKKADLKYKSRVLAIYAAAGESTKKEIEAIVARYGLSLS